MKHLKKEWSGKGWRIVRYGDYYHFYGINLIQRVLQFVTAYKGITVNGVKNAYIQVHKNNIPIDLESTLAV